MKRAGRGSSHPIRTAEDSLLAEDRYQFFRQFAAPARAGQREPDALLCRHLSARTWTVRHPALPTFPVAPYSCLKTLRPEGPDGLSALPDDCTDERDCFEPAERLRDPES